MYRNKIAILVVLCISRCEIRDDKIDTYLTAFRENFNPNSTQLVMFVLPNNRKERYDALKKCTCVDNAGKFFSL